ncbi:MAG: tetratricopeptide repeat protein [Calditrichaeota bacterium]|nr:tetratricopeptide repeat protein [Calditrichota bacterium]
MKAETPISTPRFLIADDASPQKRPRKSTPRTSLDRLIHNSEHFSEILQANPKLKSLRFDELDLLRDLREIVDREKKEFDRIKNPAEFRRMIRVMLLPKYLTPEFVKDAADKLLGQLLMSRKKADQDALMTALVFLQSHTDLELPVEDNPLWETIFNISLQDGLKFVDSLTVLTEGMNQLKISDPELLSRDPLVLQKTKQICQWHVFWRQLISRKGIMAFEGLISSILRGDFVIELYFDELVHLPYYLYALFKKDLNDPNFLTETIPDGDKEKLAKDLSDAILHCVEVDLPFVLPQLIKRLEKALKKQSDPKLIEQLKEAIQQLKSENDPVNNIFLIMLIAAKISMKKYWESQRDRFFFFTILKNPLDAKNYFDYGNILVRIRKSRNAEQLFRCAIEIDPESFWGYWGLGQFFLKKNKHKDAENYLSRALKTAQKQALQNPRKLHRELFLINEDLKKLKRLKIKKQVEVEPQIELF